VIHSGQWVGYCYVALLYVEQLRWPDSLVSYGQWFVSVYVARCFMLTTKMWSRDWHSQSQESDRWRYRKGHNRKIVLQVIQNRMQAGCVVLCIDKGRGLHQDTMIHWCRWWMNTHKTWAMQIRIAYNFSCTKIDDILSELLTKRFAMECPRPVFIVEEPTLSRQICIVMQTQLFSSVGPNDLHHAK
jgi:hypothetical protein